MDFPTSDVLLFEDMEEEVDLETSLSTQSPANYSKNLFSIVGIWLVLGWGGGWVVGTRVGVGGWMGKEGLNEVGVSLLVKGV